MSEEYDTSTPLDLTNVSNIGNIVTKSPIINTIENTMEEIIPKIQVETTLVHSPNISRSEDISKILNQAINLNRESVIHEPTCLICESPYREDIEKKFLEKKSYLEAKNFFKDKSKRDIDLGVFENHFDNHLTASKKEIQKVEFVSRVKRLYDQNLTTMDKISMAVAIITERIIGVNGLSPSNTESLAEIEKIKCSETSRLTSCLHSLLKLQAQILGEMKNSGELTTIPTTEFVNVFIEAMQNAKSDTSRREIRNLLDKLEILSKKTQY